jgi:hypothetical protein
MKMDDLLYAIGQLSQQPVLEELEKIEGLTVAEKIYRRMDELSRQIDVAAMVHEALPKKLPKRMRDNIEQMDELDKRNQLEWQILCDLVGQCDQISYDVSAAFSNLSREPLDGELHHVWMSRIRACGQQRLGDLALCADCAGGNKPIFGPGM